VHEANRLPLCTSEVKSAWSYTSFPHVFMAWCLINTVTVFALPYTVICEISGSVLMIIVSLPYGLLFCRALVPNVLSSL
jgi:hypothetical protein